MSLLYFYVVSGLAGANFGRFIRMQEPERWDYWHKQWRSDPQMMEDMYDTHLMTQVQEVTLLLDVKKPN